MKETNPKKLASALRHQIDTKGMQFPVIVERGIDDWYVIQCPVLDGCFTQGQTLDEALTNIKEVIEICLEEEAERSPEDFENLFRWKEVGLHTVTL